MDETIGNLGEDMSLASGVVNILTAVGPRTPFLIRIPNKTRLKMSEQNGRN